MMLPYIKTSLQLSFETPVQWSVIPTFFLRTVLGAQLKRTSCVQRQLTCDNCILAQTCAYSVLFESPLPIDNSILQGRNRSYHPFILTHTMVADNGKRYQFVLTLVGKGIEYFPFVIFAFQQAGREGIFSSRVHYEISMLRDCATGQELAGEKLRMPSIQQFCYKQDESIAAHTVTIMFRTPARIKYQGHYTIDFDVYSFFAGLHRRITALQQLYATDTVLSKTQLPIEYHIIPEIQISARHLGWKDIPRYSHRQNTEMELGGVIGSMELNGPLRRQDLSLLESGNLFHVGKNTGFGLGEMIYTIHENN